MKEGIAWSRILWNVLPSAFGASGVELFLLISGFLIHLAYLRSKSTLKLGAFYSKRFWRIYPPYIISIILLYPISTNAGGRDLLLHALLLHNLSEVSFFSMNPSYWSLALEAQLYLVYPLLLLFREKWGFKQTLIMLCVLSILASIQQYVYAPSSAVLDKSLLKFWVFWAFGAFLAEYHVHGQRFFRVHGVWLFGVGLLIVLSKFTTLHQPLKFYLYTLFHAVLLERFLTYPNFRGPWMVHSDVKGSVLLGLASYSFYLFHQPMILGDWVDLFGNTGLG
ncbi:MAG: acyltransferase family protein [Flavobacteriales bacterium]|nr:acyltransferase family protein [Flavobacteriales bacterium]